MICSVVEPTLLKRAPPLSPNGKLNNFPDADMRHPPISIGLTCPIDTAGWGKSFVHNVRAELGHCLIYGQYGRTHRRLLLPRVTKPRKIAKAGKRLETVKKPDR